MKQCPLYVWGDRLDTAQLICLSPNWRRLSRGASSFMPSEVPHQLVMFVDLMDVFLIPRDLITCFTEGLVCRRCWTFAGQGADYEHDRISKLRAEWQPQGAAWTLMTCINGAWPSFWLLLSLEVILSRRCPVSLCYPVVYGQAGVGLICTLTPVLFRRSRGHSRMIKYSAGWELGARGLFTRGF